MQKLLKSRIFLVIITFLITLSCTVYATTRYLASEIEYKETTVEDALNDLYTVHETYKNLTSDTTVTSQNLLKGITAYNKNGELVTGDATNCINNTYIMEQSCTTLNGCKILDFDPSIFILYTSSTSTFSNGSIYYYNSSVSTNDFVTSYDDGSDGIYRVGSKSNRFTTNNGFYLHNLGATYVGMTMHYIACK